MNYKLPECYIYLYHTDEYFILPQYPDTLQDQLDSNFSSQNALSRTAPVYSYNNSGPRSIQITLKLHRDMMNNFNTGAARIKYNTADGDIETRINNDDYVDLLIKKLQSIALPRYKASDKLVNPPMVAVRFGDTVFIKGIVQGGVSVVYDLPILVNNKYAQATISFTVSEIQPYDADSVGKLGSLRGITSDIEKKIKAINN
ncbi:MAG: hypothetical protein M0Q88_00465 [Bacilli bacterium]|nr:hypothetical protein [Bacilli bacterium]